MAEDKGEACSYMRRTVAKAKGARVSSPDLSALRWGQGHCPDQCLEYIYDIRQASGDA